MIIVKGLLIGLICGVILGGIVMVIVEGPTSLFSTESSWLGPKRNMLPAVLTVYVGAGAILGMVLGLVVGLVMAFIRR